LGTALEHRLPKPLTYFPVLAGFAFLTTLVMMFTPLQLPAVQHYSSCDGCARDTEENRILKESVVDKTYLGKN